MLIDLKERDIDQGPPIWILTGIKPATFFGTWDDAPSNWATWPGKGIKIVNDSKLFIGKNESQKTVK